MYVPPVCLLGRGDVQYLRFHMPRVWQPARKGITDACGAGGRDISTAIHVSTTYIERAPNCDSILVAIFIRETS